MSENEFPKKLYIYQEEDGDDIYFICCRTLREAASLGEDRFVGIYELKDVGAIAIKVDVITQDDKEEIPF